MQTIKHMFMVGDTVTGAIKKYNMHHVSESEMEYLLQSFIDINGIAVMRPGQLAAIPILERSQDIDADSGNQSV